MTDWFKIQSNTTKTHKKFDFLCNVQYTSERNLFASWVEEFHIKDGVNKTINQFQETFHSMFWEVYLNKVFKEAGFVIDNSVVSPDFSLEKSNTKIFVEAVVSNIAEAERKECERTLDEIYGENDHYEILNESITRMYNSFCTKLERFENHYSNNEAVLNSPFVLAMGDYAQINYGQSRYYPLLALLYGAYYDKDDKLDELKILCNDSFDKEYKYLKFHKKKNGANLELGLFNDEKFKHVAAIIYSCTTTLGKLSSLSEDHLPLEKCIVLDRELPCEEYQILRYSGQQSDETLYDGIFIYHNPYATHKLPDDFLNNDGVVHIRYNQENEPAISINFSQKKGVLNRRQVSMKGTERVLLTNFEDFNFVPMART
ncbi:hypothetical protein [Shewanella oncorhynchi]|uniref:hypothetical protein n=1 Tax=Shewanella oncorhynchi TaxID=2726434 RepID=UPI003D7B1764